MTLISFRLLNLNFYNMYSISQFLSMKLEAVNSRMGMNPVMDGFPPKDVSLNTLIDCLTYLSSQRDCPK